MLAERITSPRTDRTQLTPFPTHSSELFVVSQNVNSLRIRQIRTHALKHPGYGYPERLYDANRVGIPAPLIDFHTLCFHGLTNPFSSNPFPFTSIQNGGACEVGRLQIKMEKRQAGFQRGQREIYRVVLGYLQPATYRLNPAKRLTCFHHDATEATASLDASRMRNGVLFITACLPPPAAKEPRFLRPNAGYSS